MMETEQEYEMWAVCVCAQCAEYGLEKGSLLFTFLSSRYSSIFKTRTSTDVCKERKVYNTNLLWGHQLQLLPYEIVYTSCLINLGTLYIWSRYELMIIELCVIDLSENITIND